MQKSGPIPVFELSRAPVLDALVRRLIDTPPTGPVEAWLFEDRMTRHAAELRLAAHSIEARFRSAYKPLVHAFREELAGLRGPLRIRYPVIKGVAAERFLLEAYPLAALLPDAVFIPQPETAPLYRIEARDAAGAPITHIVHAPNRWHADRAGRQVFSPTGWLRLAGEAVGERLETDLEAVIDQTLDWIASRPVTDKASEPRQLVIDFHLRPRDEPLGVMLEVSSLCEAVHEDLYFSILEIGEAGLAGLPGQIAPMVKAGWSTTACRIYLHKELDDIGEDTPPQNLDTAAAPLSFRQIRDELAAMEGKMFTVTSWRGRAVTALHHAGSGPGLLLTAGRHANETSGIVGALRAGRLLAAAGKANFILSPLENPDGYALHRAMCRDNPGHMLHAARYSALGDDVATRRQPPLHEAAIQGEQRARLNITLHVDLHGYPSHEWTRPFSGYVPNRFPSWTIPKGHFFIIEHRPESRADADDLLNAITTHLASVPGLLALNTTQQALNRHHAPATPGFVLHNGFGAIITENPALSVPIYLVSEFPDETLSGPDFLLAHTAQMQTALAAHHWLTTSTPRIA